MAPLALAEYDRARARADLAAALSLLALRKGPTHPESREGRELLAASAD